jgi:hypothetical protein
VIREWVTTWPALDWAGGHAYPHFAGKVKERNTVLDGRWADCSELEEQFKVVMKSFCQSIRPHRSRDRRAKGSPRAHRGACAVAVALPHAGCDTERGDRR